MIAKINNEPKFKDYCYSGHNPDEVYNPSKPTETLINLTSSLTYSIQPNLEEYKCAGFIIPDLLRCGVMFKNIKADNCTKIREYMDNSANKSTLIKIIENLKLHRFDSKKLKDMEFTALLLKEAKFSLENLQTADFSISELKQAGFSLENLKTAKFSIKELLESNQFTHKDLIDADFDRNEVLNYERIKLDELYQRYNDKHIHPKIILKLEGLKAARFTLKELCDLDIPRIDLKKAGFSLDEFKALQSEYPLIVYEAFTLKELIDSSYPPFELEELKQFGYNLIDNLSYIFNTGKYTYGEIKTMYDLYIEEFKSNPTKKKEIETQFKTFESSIPYCKKTGFFSSGFKTECISTNPISS